MEIHSIQKKRSEQPEPPMEGENKSLIYMMTPQEMEEDTIDLWQLLLPLVKYKLQIFLFLIVGVLAAFFIPKFFGKTIYTNTLIYKYSNIADYYQAVTVKKEQFDKDRIPEQQKDQLKMYTMRFFIPDRDFFISDEILKAVPLLKQYWDLPDTLSGNKLSEYIQDNKLILFDTEKDINGIHRITVTTDDPQKTVAALENLIHYFGQRNNQQIISENILAVNDLIRKKDDLSNQIALSAENAYPFRYTREGNKAYYYDNTSKVYIQESLQRTSRATRIGMDSLISTKNKTTEKLIPGLKRSQTLGNQLKSALIQQQELDEQLLKITIEKNYLVSSISFMEHEKVISGKEGAPGSISALKEQIRSLSTKAGKLESKKNQLSLEVSFMGEVLQSSYNLRLRLNGTPDGTWIDLPENKTDEEKYSIRQTGGDASATDQNSIKAVDTNKYNLLVSEINSEIVQLNTINYKLKNNYINLFKTIESPTLNSTTKNLVFSFSGKSGQPSELKQATSYTGPITFTRKILLISLVIALFLAIF
ncbi:hypothetical protein KKA14_01165, partial [bacterium]|nr:hypothetical protein [bacterium]